MKLIVLIATLALAACSSGDPYLDAMRTNMALSAISAGTSNYQAAYSYQPAQTSAFCYPVGRGWTCN